LILLYEDFDTKSTLIGKKSEAIDLGISNSIDPVELDESTTATDQINTFFFGS